MGYYQGAGYVAWQRQLCTSRTRIRQKGSRQQPAPVAAYNDLLDDAHRADRRARYGRRFSLWVRAPYHSYFGACLRPCDYACLSQHALRHLLLAILSCCGICLIVIHPPPHRLGLPTYRPISVCAMPAGARTLRYGAVLVALPALRHGHGSNGRCHRQRRCGSSLTDSVFGRRYRPQAWSLRSHARVLRPPGDSEHPLPARICLGGPHRGALDRRKRSRQHTTRIAQTLADQLGHSQASWLASAPIGAASRRQHRVLLSAVAMSFKPYPLPVPLLNIVMIFPEAG